MKNEQKEKDNTCSGDCKKRDIENKKKNHTRSTKLIRMCKVVMCLVNFDVHIVSLQTRNVQDILIRPIAYRQLNNRRNTICRKDHKQLDSKEMKKITSNHIIKHPQ